MEKKKICVLGLSEHQLNGIKILAKNFLIIGIDSDQSAVGKKFVHRFYNISVLEKEKILKICKKLNVVRVLSFNSEICLKSQIWLNSKLFGFSLKNWNIVLNKSRLRNFFLFNNLPCPKFYYSKNKSVKEWSKFPAIIKPVIGSGSRGVFLMKTIENLKKVLVDQKKIYSKGFIIEEYIPGIEYALEGWCINGKFYLGCISRKFRSDPPHLYDKFLNINISHRILEKKIIKLMQLFFNKVNIDNVPIHAEFKFYKKEIYIIDLSLRGAGFGVYSEILSKIINVNTDKLLLNLTFGNYQDEIVKTKKKFTLIFFNSYEKKKIIKKKIELKKLKTFYRVIFYKKIVTITDRSGCVLLSDNKIKTLNSERKKVLELLK